MAAKEVDAIPSPGGRQEALAAFQMIDEALSVATLRASMAGFRRLEAAILIVGKYLEGEDNAER